VGRERSTGRDSTVHDSTDSAVQYSTVQYSAVQYSTVQCSAVQYSTVQCSAVLPLLCSCAPLQRARTGWCAVFKLEDVASKNLKSVSRPSLLLFILPPPMTLCTVTLFTAHCSL